MAMQPVTKRGAQPAHTQPRCSGAGSNYLLALPRPRVWSTAEPVGRCRWSIPLRAAQGAIANASRRDWVDKSAVDDPPRRPAEPRIVVQTAQQFELPELPRPRASYRRVKVRPRRCMWGRARSRREGRRRLAREPAGGKRETEDCGRANTASNSSWWRCNAAGRSGSLSLLPEAWPPGHPPLHDRQVPRRDLALDANLVASVLWHTGGAHHRCTRATSSSGKRMGITCRSR